MSYLWSPRAMIWPTLRAIEISSLAATRGAFPAHCVDGRTIIDELIREKWLIGRESTPKDKGRLP
jgi:hypothetical protein